MMSGLGFLVNRKLPGMQRIYKHSLLVFFIRMTQILGGGYLVSDKPL